MGGVTEWRGFCGTAIRIAEKHRITRENEMIEKRQFYINGEWVDPVTPNDHNVIDPSTEEPCAVISLGSSADVDKAVAAAKAAFPAWMKACWALGVWGSLLGSLGLLLRKAWAVWLFGISILGLAGSTVYNFILSDGLAAMGSGGAMFTAVIWVIALLLFFYARAMARRGVLR